MQALPNTAIRYQVLHLPDRKHALGLAHQQVTKAWAQHGGWPTSFPKEAMIARWGYQENRFLVRLACVDVPAS